MNVSRPDVCGLRTADVINDLAMFIDMVAVLIPSRFLLLICVSSVLKAMSVPYTKQAQSNFVFCFANSILFAVIASSFRDSWRHLKNAPLPSPQVSRIPEKGVADFWLKGNFHRLDFVSVHENSRTQLAPAQGRARALVNTTSPCLSVCARERMPPTRA